MKKLLLTSALAVIATLSSYGQGSVGFANASASRVWLDTGTGTATTYLPSGGTYNAELVFAPDGTPTASFDAVATRVGGAITFFSAGLFNGGGRTVNQGITPAGGFGLFQVRVWDTRTGSDYLSASLNPNGFVGTSQILRVDTGDPTTVPPGTPTPLTGAGLASFTVSPVPEPSVIGLGLLGVGTLLMLRRRK